MAINALMKFLVSKDRPVPGEGQSAVDLTGGPKSSLMSDFKPGEFFEVEDFDFGIELNDSDKDQGTDQITKALAKSKDPHASELAKQLGRQGLKYSGFIRGDSSWRVGTDAQMEPFSFTKQVDMASTMLISNCFKRIMFDSAALIKFRDSGVSSTAKATDVAKYVYLRIDFSDVLVVNVDWDGQEIVKEKIKFVCRKVEINYTAQEFSGTPKAKAEPAKLDLNAAAAGQSK